MLQGVCSGRKERFKKGVGGGQRGQRCNLTPFSPPPPSPNNREVWRGVGPSARARERERARTLQGVLRGPEGRAQHRGSAPVQRCHLPAGHQTRSAHPAEEAPLGSFRIPPALRVQLEGWRSRSRREQERARGSRVA